MCEEHKGLCSTCVCKDECTYIRNMDRPVIQCLEFKGINEVQEQRLICRQHGKGETVRDISTPISTKQEQESESKFKGLCKMCSLRNECVFPKPAGGVWHCEEYE